jgi:hypothetical protein
VDRPLNRRREALEGLDRTGFLSGQVLGFVVLGLIVPARIAHLDPPCP